MIMSIRPSAEKSKRQNGTVLFLAAMGCAMMSCIVVTGCTTDGYPLDNTYHYQGKAPSAAPQPSTYAYRYPDSAPVLEAKDLQDFVGKFRHRVVLLDFWASWSRQTREEITMLSRLQEEMEEEGFQVIACNFDPEEKWISSTVPMLHAANANYPCLVIPESAKQEIRKWLAPNWNYDLPARFIINRQGIVSTQAFGNTALSVVEQQARQAVNNGGQTITTKLSSSSAALRVKILDCKTGKAESLPEVLADPASARRLAEQVAQYVESRVDRSLNPRIALLAFGDSKERRKAGPLGNETAQQLETELKDKGYTDIIPADQTERILQENKLSAMSLDYEPTFVKGKLSADFLVIGWLRMDSSNSASPDAAAAKAPRHEPTIIVKEHSLDE